MTKTLKTKIITVLFALFSVIIGAASFLSFSRTASAEESANTNVFRIDGASVRLPDETYGNGLRFHVVLPKADYEALGSKETGALVLPYQKLSSGASLEVGTASAQSVVFEAADWQKNANGDYEALVTLTNIPDENVGNLIVARAYIKNGDTYTYTAQKATSLSAVALASYNAEGTSEAVKETLKANYLEEVTYYNGSSKTTEVVACGSVLSKPDDDKIWYTEGGEQYSFGTTRVKSALSLYAVAEKNYIDSSSDAASVDLSSFTSNGYSVSSMKLGSINLGSDASSFDATDLTSSIGDQTLSVTFSDETSISVPVTVITGYITTKAEFISKVRTNQGESGNKNGYYVLANDITLVPTGDYVENSWAWVDFKGTFDGNGHKITSKDVVGGAFGVLNGATIKNLVIENVYMTGDSNESLLARKILNSTLEDVEIKVTDTKSGYTTLNTDDGYGMLVAWSFTGNTVKNLHIDASNYDIGSIFSGRTNGFKDNTFSDSWIKCNSVVEIAHNGSEIITQVDGFEVNPIICAKHEYVCEVGSAQDIVKCKNCGKEVLTFNKGVSAENQFIAKEGSNSVSLSGVSEYSSVVSVKLGGVSLGTDLSALDISSANAATGANVLTVVVRDSYGCDHSISVPVTIISGYITTAEEFFEKVNAYDKSKSGYYVLKNDIDVSSTTKYYQSETYDFTGTFDGNGKKIKAKGATYGGLFCNLNNAIVKDLEIEDGWSNNGANSGNALIAHKVVNSTLENISVKISDCDGDNIKYQGDNAGLLAAWRFSGNTVTNLHIDASSYTVGSLFGGNATNGFGSKTCTFTDCWIKCKALLEFGHGTTNYQWNDSTDPITELNGFEVNDDASAVVQSVSESEVVNLCITDGNVNTSATHTFKDYGIKQEYLQAIKFNGETLGNEGFSVSVSAFGKTYGEGVVTLCYQIGGKYGELEVPVILATYVLTTAADVDNFLTYAAAYDGNSNNGLYDGYFALGNDIAYNKAYTTVIMEETKGFRGVFDGRGYAIQGLQIIGAYTDEANAYNKTAFISVLHDDGVIKNVAFTGARLFRRALISSSGGGLVENVFVDVNLVTTSDPYTVIANSTRVDARSVRMRNCVVSYTGTPNKWLLGCVPETANAYIGVYLIGAAQDTYIKYGSNDAVTYESTYSYARGNDNFAQYNDIAAFLADRGGEMKSSSWAYFDVTGSALKFGDKSVLSASGAVSSKTYEGNVLISADKQSSNYVIIYEDDDYAQNAAAFIAEHIARATGSIAYAEKGVTGSADWTSQTLTGGIRLPMMTGAPHAYNANAAFIVIGNVEIEGLSYADYANDYSVITLGNSVLVRAKNKAEYITAATLFLENTIGYSALSDDLVYYHNVNGSAVTVSSLNYDRSAAYAVRSNINWSRTWKNDQTSQNGRDYFSIGPTDANGNVQTFHNSIYWFDYGKADADNHSDWIRKYTHGNVTYYDVCYANLNDSSLMNSQDQTAVQVVAQNMRKVLIANPGKTVLTFSLQDNDLNGCTCNNCKNANKTDQAVTFLNAVVKEIERLDKEDGIENRDFTVYMLAYYYLVSAPNVEMDSHLGVIYAPIRHSAEGASIYDDKNKDVRAQIEAWAKATDHVGFWFYDTLYHNYFVSVDTFETMLTWLEFASRTVKNEGNDVEWIYINGQTAQPNPSAFESFKNYAFSRAQVEILNKLGTLTGGTDEYNNEIKSYLNELENKFFARSGEVFTGSNYGTFSDGGYYGAAAANEAMYCLYRQMRTDYTTISSDKTTYEYLDAMQDYVSTTGLYNRGDNYNTFTEYVSGSSKKNGYLQKYTSSMMQTYMGYVETATNAAAAYTGDMACVYTRHVLAESLAPRFLMCMSASSGDSDYKYIPSDSDAATIRSAFKTDCAALGITYYGEGRPLSAVYTFWNV